MSFGLLEFRGIRFGRLQEAVASVIMFVNRLKQSGRVPDDSHRGIDVHSEGQAKAWIISQVLADAW